MTTTMDSTEVHTFSSGKVTSDLLVDVERSERLDDRPSKLMHPLLSTVGRHSTISISRIVEDSESVSDDVVDPFRGFVERVINNFIRALLPNTDIRRNIHGNSHFISVE